MFSEEVGRGELSLPQPVGYSLAANTAQYVWLFYYKGKFCLVFKLCPSQLAPLPDFVPVLFHRAAH